MLNLEEIKVREQAATPGPWIIKATHHRSKPDTYAIVKPSPLIDIKLFEVGSKGLSEFIAHARTDIPALISEVERLTAENKKLHEISSQNYGYRYIEMQDEIVTLKKALENMLFAYQNKDGDCPHQFEIEAATEANTILKLAQEEKDNAK